ncbi:MAG: glycoside hydrolase family 95 protein [Alloprevotella sp.]|nr:glycoside hydrolase family 95 protein [Alloprevotella sp.]
MKSLSTLFRLFLWCVLLGAGSAVASAQTFPEFASDAGKAKWYTIKFEHFGDGVTVKNCALEDKGEGQEVKTATEDRSNEAQLWAFIGTKDSFKLVSKKGNQAKMTGDKLTTAKTGGGDFVMKVSGSTIYPQTYVICPKSDQSKGFNCIGGIAINKSIGLWTTTDKGDCLTITSADGTVVFPNEGGTTPTNPSTPTTPVSGGIFSTKEAPVWFQVRFNRGDAALADQGAGNNLRTAASNPSADAQLWQFIGNTESFIMRSKLGNEVAFNSMYKTSDKGDELYIEEGSNGFEIGRVGSEKHMNQWTGYGTGKELGEWDAADPNNPLWIYTPAGDKVTELEPAGSKPVKGLPIFSTDGNETWYYMKWITGGRILAADGAGNAATQQTANPNPAGEWKVVGSADNCQLINRKGQYLAIVGAAGNKGSVKASANPYASGFSLIQTTNTGDKFKNKIEIKDNAGGNCLNLCGGASEGGQYCCWTPADVNNPMEFILVDDMEYGEFSVINGTTTWTPDNNFTLWYTAPGTDWMNWGLPIGNGRLGAQVLGGINGEEVSFTEKTLWTGATEKFKNGSDENSYGSFQAFGNLMIRVPGDNPDFGWTAANGASDYYRSLDLTTGTATVHFTSADGTEYTREFISSYPDKVIAMHFTASKPGKLYLNFQVDPGMANAPEVTYANGYGTFDGKFQTISYASAFKVIPTGGTMTSGEDGVTVKGANEVLVILAGNTDYDPITPSYTSGTATLVADTKALTDKAGTKGWSAIYSDHVADYKPWFDRVELNFEGASNDIPTNEMLTTYNGGNGSPAHTRAIEQMLFQYGRYMAICSNRGLDLPNNLQGIWTGYNANRRYSNSNTQPWNADIHANINIEMNYWPTEPTNLSEMHECFTNYIINQATVQPQWRMNPTTRVSNPSSTKGWSIFNENNIFGAGSSWGNEYVVGNAWYCTHLMEHYRFTLDKEFLARAFPAIWGACEFWLERLQLAKDGTYECPNESSPEHGPKENATAHAQQIVAELLAGAIEAVAVLGEDNCGISAEDIAMLKDRYEKMDKGLKAEKYTGTYGDSKNGVNTNDDILREWKYSAYTVGEGGGGHRHLSHLMALYPFGQITPDHDLFTAATNSLKLRGDAATGWSMGWKINLWARALDGDHMHQILKNMINGKLYKNLYDSHAPFQIDGNFGATSGITEALLQSQKGVFILPALPTAWADGSIHGLKARGNFTVDIDWANGKIKKATVTSVKGAKLNVRNYDLLNCRISVNGKAIEPEVYTGDNTATVPCTTGDVVTIEYDPSYTQPNTKEGHHPDNLSNAFLSNPLISVDNSANFNVTVGDGAIRVDGSDIVAVAVTDVVGRSVARGNGATTLPVNIHTGSVALVTVTFADGMTVTRKVVIR